VSIMKPYAYARFAVFTAIVLVAPLGSAFATGFNSGSTGADGAFSPASSVTLQVPPNGKFNYTTISIPFGVTVTFTRNSNNTPVYLLATGDVTINGNIDASGTDGGVTGDTTLQGRGGPGGMDGGRGGTIPSVPGGDGLGPGGGHGGADDGVKAIGGGGAGYLLAGSNALNSTSGIPGSGGAAYGSGWLQPLVGGSGGGGGSGSSSAQGLGGGGGGGGGGAILIASSGTIAGTSGFLFANGGRGAVGGSSAGLPRCDSSGGGGSGGAIHLLATAITFSSGRVTVSGGTAGGSICTSSGGGSGARGYTKFETELGGTLDVSSGPTLAITKVAGISAPATLTGYGDITIPTSTPNPVTVELTATGVPTGGTISVTVSPAAGSSVSVTSTSLAGTLASSTATAQINVPNGLSSVQASTNFTVPLALVESLTRYAGEMVKNLRLTSVMNGGSKTLAITSSGREVEIPAAMLMHVALAPN
jgi:hypothetical protein